MEDDERAAVLVGSMRTGPAAECLLIAEPHTAQDPPPAVSPHQLQTTEPE